MRTLSPTLFAPAYQELVFLFIALIESARSPPAARKLETESAALRQKVGQLKQEAEASLQKRDERWRAEAELAIDLAFDAVLRRCWNGETWLPPSPRGNLEDLQLRYMNKLRELTSGTSDRGSPPRALIELWLCCGNIVFHNDEPALRELRSKLEARLPRAEPLPLPRPAVAAKVGRSVAPLVSWRLLAGMTAAAVTAIFVTYFWAWRLTAGELVQVLREPPPAAAPSTSVTAAATSAR